MTFILPKFFSKGNDTIFKGHSLSNNILLICEVFHKFIFSKSKKELFTITIEVEQAYDSTGWST